MPTTYEPVPEPIAASREILTAARQEASRLQQEALGRISALRREAETNGFEEGLAKTQHLQETLEAWHQESIEQLQERIAEIASTIAKEVIGEELKTSPQTIISRIKRAAAFVQKCDEITLIVHPSHVSNLRLSLPQLKAATANKGAFLILGNENVSPCNAILESRDGNIISSPNRHFNSIKKRLQST
jgi:flagellar biosynthesis/type III secretory pathway protein FliH